MAEIFAYVAHKDGKWGGACSTSASKATLREFVADFAADGFALQAVKDRAEYLALLDSLELWGSGDDVGSAK